MFVHPFLCPSPLADTPSHPNTVECQQLHVCTPRLVPRLDLFRRLPCERFRCVRIVPLVCAEDLQANLLGHLCLYFLTSTKTAHFLHLDHEPVCHLGFFLVEPEREAPAACMFWPVIGSQVLVP